MTPKLHWRTAYLLTWLALALLGAIYVGSVYRQETTTPLLPDPTVLVGCSVTGCPAAPQYPQGQTVCVAWNGVPCP